MKTFWILVLGLFLCGAAVFAADTEPFKTKVNLVLDDGTVMLYAGSKKGVQNGDEYDLVRNGVKVGAIKINKVTDIASYGKVVSGDVKPMDVAVRQAAGKPAKSEPAAKEPPAKADTEKPKKEPKEKKEPKDTKKDTKKDKDADKDKEAAKDKDKEAAKAKPVEPPKSKAPVQPHAQPPTALGLSGLMLMPSADVNAANKGVIAIHRNSASDENLNYTDTMIGFTYGVSENVEVGYVSMTTSPEMPDGVTGTASDFKTNIISMKYLIHKAAPKGASGSPSGYLGGVDYSYAAGLQYFNVSSLPASVSLDGKAKVTRFFLSASGEMDMGTAHLALYSQSGDLFDSQNSEGYKGFGYQLGFEYPIGGKADGQGKEQNPLSLIAEYDDKPFYLGVLQAPSVGLRYRQESFTLTAGMLDVSNASILSLGGSYHF